VTVVDHVLFYSECVNLVPLNVFLTPFFVSVFQTFQTRFRDYQNKQGGHGYFCAVDADREVPRRSSFYPPTLRPPTRHHGGGEDKSPHKRKRDRSDSVASAGAAEKSGHNDNCTLCVRFNAILYMDFIRPDELVIVEQPWLPIANTLPDPLARHVYGS
jgi:hypothetical protein